MSIALANEAFEAMRYESALQHYQVTAALYTSPSSL